METDQVQNYFVEGLKEIANWAHRFGFSFSEATIAWTFAQPAMIIVAWLIAVGLAKWLDGPIEERLRKMRGKMAILRILTVLRKSLRFFLFVVFLWVIVGVLSQYVWTSRIQIVLSAATLATAWLVISLVAKLIRNRLIARVVAVVAWIVAALNIVGLLPETVSLFDAAAVEFGGFRLSLLVVFKGVVVFSLLVWLAIVGGRFAEERIRALEDLTPSLKVLTGKLTKALLLIFAIFGGLGLLGIDFSALTVFSGAIGLGLGFGLQKVVSNLVSGFILLTDKSIKPGDVISVGDSYGRIDQLAARYVSVRARDGREYLVPNEDLITSQVINWTFSAQIVRLDVNFGTAYESDPHEVRQLAREACATVKRVLQVPSPVCHITEFGDSSVNYVLRFWINDPDKGTVNVRGDVYLALWDALKAANVEIPFPQRELTVKGTVPVKVGAQPGRKRKAG